MQYRTISFGLFALRLRVPEFWRFAPRLRVPAVRSLLALLGGLAKWVTFAWITTLLASWGQHTSLGAGLVGVVFPLLVVEAMVSARKRWRTRAMATTQAAVPTCSLVILTQLTPGSCCFCDQRPWARALRAIEFLADVLYAYAIATVPALMLVLMIGLLVASSAERAASVRALQLTLLATLLTATWLHAAVIALSEQSLWN